MLFRSRSFACKFPKKNVATRIKTAIRTNDRKHADVGALPGGEQRQKNLRVLLQRASDYQTATLHGVFQFPDYAQPLTKRRQGDVMTPSILSENDDVVRIMTIHKSKGLEFPVVFLADCGKGANLKNATEKVKVYFHQKLGICPKWIDPSAKLYHDTLATTLVQEQVKTESAVDRKSVV